MFFFISKVMELFASVIMASAVVLRFYPLWKHNWEMCKGPGRPLSLSFTSCSTARCSRSVLVPSAHLQFRFGRDVSTVLKSPLSRFGSDGHFVDVVMHLNHIFQLVIISNADFRFDT